MAKRKANCEKEDFATKLCKMGFEQIGETTFIKNRIKIFRTNTAQRQFRHWEIQEISSGNIFYTAISSADILDYLSKAQFMPDGGRIIVSIAVKPQ